MLNPEGLNTNPLNNKEYTDRYRELAKFWSKLPVYEKGKEIMESLEKNQVILITSQTGSGKSVLMPRFVLETYNYEGKVVMTLPKQMLTVSNATFQADILDIELGKEIGYVYKGSDRKYIQDSNRLVYATDGTIVAKLMKDPLLKDINAIIVDEVHERKVQIDFLIYLLKQTCILRPDFKLILMSATVNEHIFREYFKEFKYSHIDVGGKRNYEIESIFLKEPLDKSYTDYALNLIKNILLENPDDDGDIMLFVTSINETYEICRKINTDKIYNDLFCIEVYSGIDNNVQELLQDKKLLIDKTNKSRKLVISTNVAESSLTISNIKYVIDSGLELFSYYDWDTQSRVLKKQLITKSQVKQRMGRTGRTGTGICYHLYTKSMYDSMEDYPSPAILTSNIYTECLRLLNLSTINNVNNLKDILSKFIEPPKETYINQSIKYLKKLELIENNEISKLGKIISDMQMDVEKALTLYMSYHLNCSKEVSKILSILDTTRNNISELFYTVKNEDNKKIYEKYDKAKKSLMHKYGDHLTLLKIFETYQTKKDDNKKLNNWLYDKFLKRDILEKSLKTYRKILDIKHTVLNGLEKLNFDLLSNYSLEERILSCFIYGFKINIAYPNKDNGYHNDFNSNLSISRESWINYNKKNSKILYCELFTNLTGARTKINIVICSYIPKKIIKI